MSEREIGALEIQPKQLEELLLTLHQLVCAECGIAFADHIRKGHLFIEELVVEDGQ